MRDPLQVQTALFQAIADETYTQSDIADHYARALESSGRFPWTEINQSIIARWSVSGLERIKKMAWERS